MCIEIANNQHITKTRSLSNVKFQFIPDQLPLLRIVALTRTGRKVAESNVEIIFKASVMPNMEPGDLSAHFRVIGGFPRDSVGSETISKINRSTTTMVIKI